MTSPVNFVKMAFIFATNCWGKSLHNSNWPLDPVVAVFSIAPLLKKESLGMIGKSILVQSHRFDLKKKSAFQKKQQFDPVGKLTRLAPHIFVLDFFSRFPSRRLETSPETGIAPWSPSFSNLFGSWPFWWKAMEKGENAPRSFISSLVSTRWGPRI